MSIEATSSFDCALLTCAQMTKCDRWTIEQGFASGIELMQNAGAAVADIVLRDFAGLTPIYVLCGPGNNGGDGYITAQILAERGLDIQLFALAAPKVGTDAELAAERWAGGVQPLSQFEPQIGGLVVDAIFGAGFKGMLGDEVINVFGKVHNMQLPIVAVDVPTGLDGNTGITAYGLYCDSTVTFFRKKPGHVIGYGPGMCGKLHVADIGVGADWWGEHFPESYENKPQLWQNFLPDHDRRTHKYLKGHVAVFSGPRFSTGAARLSATAAARIGSGAVTLLGDEDALAVHANHVTSIMLKLHKNGGAEGELNDLSKCRAVVLGPGYTDLAEIRAIVPHVLERDNIVAPTNLVLDADGISAFANDPEVLFKAARKRAEPALVITPHDGEFARLFPDLAANTILGKLQKAQIAAERAHAVIVYKGADTVIAAPAGTLIGVPMAAVNTNGTPVLATAGSGDVLAGMIAGLIAQGMPVFHASAAAVWLHAEAGKTIGPVCIAEDLVAAIPQVLSRLVKGNAN